MHNRPHTIETKEKMSKVRLERKEKLGYLNSPETRIKMRGKRGKFKDTSRMNKDKLGKKRPPFSKKWRDKIGKSLIGNFGDKSRNWQGGKTTLRVLIRSCFKYRQWRSDIFSRDNFTCQKCGIKGGYLEADHYPKRFSDILKEYNIKTFEEALICEELWNINNGRTLHKNCHRIKKEF